MLEFRSKKRSWTKEEGDEALLEELEEEAEEVVELEEGESELEKKEETMPLEVSGEDAI